MKRLFLLLTRLLLRPTKFTCPQRLRSVQSVLSPYTLTKAVSIRISGVKYTPIYAGDRKNDFNRHEPLKTEGKEVLQAHVNKLYDMLTAVVARNRHMTQAAVIATQAGIYMGVDAVKAGLADGVLSVRDVMTRMSSSKGDMVMNLNEVKDFITQALAESMLEVKTMLAEQVQRLEGIEAR